MTEFSIPPQTGTHADVLAAVGLAELLHRCALPVRFLVNAPAWKVITEGPVTAQGLRRLGNDPGFLYLLPNEKERPKLPALVAGQFFDYPAEKNKFDRWRELRKSAKDLGPETTEAIEGEKPDRLFQHYRVLNLLQGDGPLNKAVLAIFAAGSEWPRMVEKGLGALGRDEGMDFPFSADLVQLFNPLAAKGYARLKPDSTSRNDKSKDAWADPFQQYLQILGYFHGTIGFLLEKDIRLLTLEPARIGYGYYKAVVDSLADVRFGGSGVRVDCLATLTIARALVDHAADFVDEYDEPSALLGGIMIAHYQSLGQAKAVTALSRLSIPGWYPLRPDSETDQSLWKDTLDEHLKILRRLNDSISDELQLLTLYRRHLEHRGPAASLRLADFFEAYGIYLLRKRGQDDWRFRQFLAPRFEQIMHKYQAYSEILDNSGFQAVARALRSATVTAQSDKRNKKDHREIRYDILPELRRKRSLPKPDEFIDAVSDFVASYNAESARRVEQNKRTGTVRIAEGDFSTFVSLFEREKSPAIVGALLCAYATCKSGKEAAPEQEAGEPEREED